MPRRGNKLRQKDAQLMRIPYHKIRKGNTALSWRQRFVITLYRLSRKLKLRDMPNVHLPQKVLCIRARRILHLLNASTTKNLVSLWSLRQPSSSPTTGKSTGPSDDELSLSSGTETSCAKSLVDYDSDYSSESYETAMRSYTHFRI